MVVLLIAFWLSRLHELLLLPLFLDEASHLTRAQWVWEGRPLYLLETGKALAPYLSALLNPYNAAPFVGRIVVVLISAVGLAAAYAVGRMLHSRLVGLLTMILWIAAPQLMFYERMALVDTTMGALAMVTVWAALRMLHGGSRRSAAVCGVCLTLTILAKLTGLVYLVIPVVVALVIARCPWRLRIRQCVIAYSVAALTFAAPALYLATADADPTGQRSGLTSTEPGTLGLRVENNWKRAIEAERAYFTDWMLAVIVAASLAGLLLKPRPILLLWALTLIPLVVILATGNILWQRYLSPMAPFMLMASAIGLTAIANRLAEGANYRAPSYALPWGVVLLWAVTVGLPFHQIAYSDPSRLPLPDGDRREYIDWIPSGYGLREAAAYMNRTFTEPVTVIGLAVNCNAARLYLAYGSPVTLDCPSLHWGGDNPDLEQTMWLRLARDGWLIVLTEDKNPPTVDLTPFRGRTQLASFTRPALRNTVRLIRLRNP